MKLKTKTVLIIILTLASIVSVFYLLSSSKKTQVPLVTVPAKPALIQNYRGKFTIALSVNKNQFSFPEKLPFLEIETPSSPLNESVAKKIAGGLDFPGEPIKIDDSMDGTTFFWKNDKNTLFVYLESGKIRFGSNVFSSVFNKQLSNTAVSSLAQTFVAESELLDENSFQTGTIRFLEKISNGEGFKETAREKAVLYQVSILPKTVNYEFVSSLSVEPTSYVQIAQDGSVYSSQIIVFPTLRSGTTEYKLKDYDRVNSSLNDAVLIELRGETALLSDLPTDLIQNIEINKIEIAYLIESSKATFFQPVYKLSGEATLKTTNNKTFATLYLSAITDD